ncbi:MAG: carbohydrate-binding family 9-like protein, partial [Segetibacter sp.]
TEWHIMPQRRDTTNSNETKFKMLYSNKGVYFLFNNEDAFLTASRTADFDSLWLEDVNEVFLWPDTTNTIYFEYEISPLNFELPILVPNLGGKFLGWRPWLYTDERRTRHLTKVLGGSKQNGSRVKGWISEFFIPYKLLAPLLNVPPVAGTVWRANMYRIDHDNNKSAAWSWQKTETNFHQFEKFGRLVFQ